MEAAKHLDITCNKDDYAEDIKKILKEIRPQWKQEKTEIKSLSGGLVNKTLRVIHDGNLDDGFIIRINGTIGEQFGVSREKELKYIKLLNKNGLGVPLIASFNNGIVSKMVHGKALDDTKLVDKMVDEKFVRQFAGILARIHHATPKDTEPMTKENCQLMVFSKESLQRLREIKNHKGLDKFNELVTWDQMEKEVDALYAKAEKLQMPTCLSHNDLWHTNMLYDEATDTINVLDYETMDINFEAFDVAVYILFVTSAYIVPGLPSPKHVAPEFPDFFIRCYLEAKAELDGKPPSSVTDADVKKYHNWCNMCTLINLLFYTPTMIFLTHYQEINGEDVDVVEVARIWYQEYKKLNDKYKF